MGDYAERSRVIRVALRSSWRTVLVLGLTAFVCVTAAVGLVVGFDDQTPPEGSACRQDACEGQPDGDSGGDGSASGAGFGTAAALGAVAALITSAGTATGKVLSAVAHLRLASASSDAIRAGHMPPLPPPGLPDGEDGAPTRDSA